jgi:beta-glucuronidase
MLKPQQTKFREVISLDGLWNFEVVNETSDNEVLWTKPLSPRRQVPVPASYNDIFLDTTIREHVGWVKYQRRVRVPSSWAGKRYFLRCDAATHSGKVYIDEKLSAEHEGGYTPFDVELTDLVNAGEESQVTVAVSNELTFETIPPGRIEVLEDGRKKQTYLHDFFNYSGLARSVWLYALPTNYIADATITTDIDWDRNMGSIKFRIEACSDSTDSSTVANVIVKDETGHKVADAEGFDGSIDIANPQLWQPGAAYLYDVMIELRLSSDNSLIDTYHISTGIRTIEVRGAQFLLNNKPFYFTGFGKHEDTPIRGKGHDAAYMVHDFELMDWLGANSFRTSHYPYAEEVLDYADRQGIVVIDETAAVGLNLGVASGLFGHTAPNTWGELVDRHT